MPLLNKIGNHQFLFLRGPWVPPVEDLRIERRPGVDGIEITKTGQRGRPFQWLSMVDASTPAEAVDLLFAYRELVGQDAVSVVKENATSDSAGFKCAVLAVEERRIIALATSIGGLNPPSRGWIEAVWTLIAIANPPEE